MTEATGTVPAIGWRMYRPTVLGGGTVYSICVIERYVITAWGSYSAAGLMGAGTNLNMERYASSSIAMRVAVELTEMKEGEKYTLDLEPRRFTQHLLAPDGTRVPINEDMIHQTIRYGTQVVV
jgi:hypothetical protein